jgi:hypothetical protein
MERIRTFPRMFSLVMFLGIASLAMPLTAHAGGLHVSVGLGLPCRPGRGAGASPGRPAWCPEHRRHSALISSQRLCHRTHGKRS